MTRRSYRAMEPGCRRYRRNPSPIVRDLILGAVTPESMSIDEIRWALQDPELPAEWFRRLTSDLPPRKEKEAWPVALANPNIPPASWDAGWGKDPIVALNNPAFALRALMDPDVMNRVLSSVIMHRSFVQAARIVKRLDGQPATVADFRKLEQISRELPSADRSMVAEFKYGHLLNGIVKPAMAREYGLFVGVPFVPAVWDAIFEATEPYAPDLVAIGRKFKRDIEKDIRG